VWRATTVAIGPRPVAWAAPIVSQHADESYVWALLEGGVAGYGYLHKVRVGDVDRLVRVMREVVTAEQSACFWALISLHRAGRGDQLRRLAGQRDALGVAATPASSSIRSLSSRAIAA